MLRKLLTLGIYAAAIAFGTLPVSDSAFAEYPERPVTWIVPWGAGGGTDATSRMLAGLVEKELGVPVNVVNRTGGSGVVGHTAIANAAPDGYTVGTVTVEIGMMHWVGLTKLDHSGYTPIALYNADPAGLHVRADAPFNSAVDVLNKAKENPGQLKGSGTGQGGIWHLALAGMLHTAGIESNAIPWVPSKGAAPAMQDLVSGGVDIVTCSVPEAASLISAGKAKTLAVMSDERLASNADLPTLKEAAGIDWKVGSWRGVAAPAGIPDDVKTKLAAAVQKAWNSQEFVSFMENRGFGLIWKDSHGFGQWMIDSDQAIGTVMKAAGLAK
jgi:tripartite-type tricarboxylate transporter receptor subunit TctC